jgi:mono/diheme cytochrome c family protein
MPGMSGHDTASVTGAAPLNRNEAVPMTGGADASSSVFHPSTSPGDGVAEAQHGADLFAANCAGCHGSAADGRGDASGSLLPKPANLLASRFTDQRLSAVLWNGAYGSAMPAWREYSGRDPRDMVAYIQQQPRSAEPQAPLDPPKRNGSSSNTARRVMVNKAMAGPRPPRRWRWRLPISTWSSQSAKGLSTYSNTVSLAPGDAGSC